jgi:hypothetical protein
MSILCTVRLEMKGGDVHLFPSMSRTELSRVVAHLNTGASTLLLCNAGGAVLTMPLRAVARIFCDEEMIWTCPKASSPAVTAND